MGTRFTHGQQTPQPRNYTNDNNGGAINRGIDGNIVYSHDRNCTPLSGVAGYDDSEYDEAQNLPDYQ